MRVRMATRNRLLAVAMIGLVAGACNRGGGDAPAEGLSPAMAAVEVERTEPSDVTIGDEWNRKTHFPDVYGVTVTRDADDGPWAYMVTVWAMEFVRGEPLQGELVRAVEKAIRSVPSVDEIERNDRESWIVAGAPDGEVLLRAVAVAVDGFGERIEALMESFDAGAS